MHGSKHFWDTENNKARKNLVFELYFYCILIPTSNKKKEKKEKRVEEEGQKYTAEEEMRYLQKSWRHGQAETPVYGFLSLSA